MDNPAPVDEDVRQLVISGQKIEAIKLVRERRHIGLKESKEYVEAIEAGLDPALRPQVTTITPNAIMTWLFYLALVAAIIYAAMRWG
jgi:hypothetical protein